MPLKCTRVDALTGRTVEIEANGTIRAVRDSSSPAAGYIAPGFIDIQVNGFMAVDYNRPDITEEEIALSINAQFQGGMTRFFPTVITGDPERMRDCLANLAKAKTRIKEGAAIEGFHVEGPYISAEDGPRGAHPERWVREPDVEEYRRWQEAAGGLIKIVTISPEWPGAPRFIETIVADGVVASIGHTGADASQIADAVAAGATLSTHLGNGAHATMRRHPNYIWEQLAEDRLMADFIVDGIHLGASYLKVALRAKGIERSVLVTDAAAPSGAAPGRYMLGEVEVDYHADNRVTLAGGDRLAGSGLRMDHGVENLMKLAGLSLADAVRMATVNAAKAGRIARRQQGLVEGERTDFVFFDFDAASHKVTVQETWVGGERVF